MIYNANVYNANSNDINDYNAKITEIENKIPSISDVTTNSNLNALKYLMLVINSK